MNVDQESLRDAAIRLRRVIIQLKPDDSSDGKCSICHESLIGKSVVHLPCGHSLPHSCHVQLCQSHCQSREKCPVCRASFIDGMPTEKREQMIEERSELLSAGLMDVLSEDDTDADQGMDSDSDYGLVGEYVLFLNEANSLRAARRMHQHSEENVTVEERASELYARMNWIQDLRRNHEYTRRLQESILAEEYSYYGMGLAELFGEAEPPTPEQIEVENRGRWVDIWLDHNRI